MNAGTWVARSMAALLQLSLVVPPGSEPRSGAAVVHRAFVDAAIVERTHPAYPVRALRQRVEAVVVVLAHIHADGTVSVVGVGESSAPGYGFESAAVDAVARWRYEPPRLDGRRLGVLLSVRVEFSLP
jgi:TonB family protein